MSIRDDDLTTRELPERLFYATGVFLDAEDLAAEQRYHRSRLSRVLAYLHGVGTAAGLRVEWDAGTSELRVQPGLAIDRLGRMIEVPRRACVKLHGWLAAQRQQAASEPEGVAHPLELAVSADGTRLQVDVFLRFAVWERGRTPAFATGPYDAIDASVPHRLRDSYELTLELRGRDAPTPTNPWPARTAGQSFAAYTQDVQRHILDNAWVHHGDWPDDNIPPDPSTSGVRDPSSVFLARVTIPVTVDGDGLPVWRTTSGALASPTVANDLRSFVLGGAALMRWMDAARTP